MTNGQPTGPDSPMEDTGGVSGMMNLTINLPDNIRISTVGSDEEEENDMAGANVTGTVVVFAGRTAPEGWLLCNGAEASRVTYADLFAVIGTDYGVGNGSTTFNLPDFRGRFPLGLDNMGGVSADRVTTTEADEPGGSGGAETHTLTTAEMPSHNHRLPVEYGGGSRGAGIDGIRSNTTYKSRGATYSTGGSLAHNNMPPWQTANYIIKT